MSRRALTHLGADVRIVGRRADARAVVVFLDRRGAPLPGGHTATAHAHELRGIGWHLAAIKAAIAAAPLFGAAPVVSPSPIPEPGSVPPGTAGAPSLPARRAGGFLHVDYTIPDGDR